MRNKKTNSFSEFSITPTTALFSHSASQIHHHLLDSIVSLANGDGTHDVGWPGAVGLPKVLANNVPSHAEAHQDQLCVWPALHILGQHQVKLIRLTCGSRNACLLGRLSKYGG